MENTVTVRLYQDGKILFTFQRASIESYSDGMLVFTDNQGAIIQTTVPFITEPTRKDGQ